METTTEVKGKWSAGFQKAKELGRQGSSKAKSAVGKVNSGFEKLDKLDGFEKFAPVPSTEDTDLGSSGGFEKLSKTLAASKERVVAEKTKLTTAAVNAFEKDTDQGGFEKFGKTLAEKKEKLATEVSVKKEQAQAMREQAQGVKEQAMDMKNQALENMKVPTSLRSVGEIGAEKLNQAKEAVIPQESDSSGAPSPLSSEQSPKTSMLGKARLHGTQGVSRLKEGLSKIKDTLPVSTEHDDDDEPCSRQHSTSLAPAPQRSPSPHQREAKSRSQENALQEATLEEDMYEDEALMSTAVQRSPPRSPESPPRSPPRSPSGYPVQARRGTIPMSVDTTLFEEKVGEDDQTKLESEDDLQVSGVTPMHKSVPGEQSLRSTRTASPAGYAALLKALEDWDCKQLQSVRDASYEVRLLRESLLVRNERTETKLRAHRH